MYVEIGFDSRVQQTGADLKAISLRRVECAGSSHGLAGFDLKHVWITFMSAGEEILCDLHVSVGDFFFLAAGAHSSVVPKLLCNFTYNYLKKTLNEHISLLSEVVWT